MMFFIVLWYLSIFPWVQDWLLMTGVLKESGIMMDLPSHNIYSFDEDGKVKMMVVYFNDEVKFKMEQVGYPDCIYYAKNDIYGVYSWRNLIVIKDGKKHEIPLMLSHDFNDEGEVVRYHVYTSDNHFDFFDE